MAGKPKFQEKFQLPSLKERRTLDPRRSSSERSAMKTTSSKAAGAAVAASLLCAVLGAARAELIYAPPAATADSVLMPAVPEENREEQTLALAARRQTMIADCEQNNGIDCEREVDTELGAERLQDGVRVIRLRRAR